MVKGDRTYWVVRDPGGWEMGKYRTRKEAEAAARLMEASIRAGK